jgi:hypothetical protein
MSTSDATDLADIDSWINEAVEQFNRETKLNVVTAALSVTGGEGTYTLDTDILAMQALWYAPADAQSALLTPLAPETLIERRLIETGEETAPRYYALAGANTLLLWPNPTSDSETLHVLYVPRHTALSVTSDSPGDSAHGNIPAEYHPILEAYAKWKACEGEDHRMSQFGNVFKTEWDTGVAKVRAEVKKKAGVNIPSVRIGYQRHVPVGNGIDRR